MNEFSFSNLKEKPELYKDTISLIEKSFNYSSDNHYDVDFAPLMNSENRDNCHLLLKENKVIGHIGVRKVNFGNKNETFPFYMLGGICILEEYRGQKLFAPFITHVLSLYEKAPLFCLWSDKEDFYQKFNFFQAGGQIIIETDGIPNAPTEGPYKFSELSIEDISQMMMIYEDFASDKWTIQRDMSDWEILKEIESCQIHFIPSRLEPHGYLISNKGQDLSGVTHEVVFYEGLFDRFKNHLATKQAWIPEGLTEGEPSLYTGFFKVGDPYAFSNMIHKLTKGEVLITSLDENNIIFNFQGDTFEAHPKEFLRYLFGPTPLEDFKEIIQPLIISGLDSI